MNGENLNYAGENNFIANQERAPENGLLGSIMEQSRECPDGNDTPTPLEEILKSVYDLSSNGKDFISALNSTMNADDPRLLNSTNYGLNLSSDSSLYVSAQSNSMHEPSMYVTAPIVPNLSNYQPNVSQSFQRPANDYMEYLLEQKMYNVASTSNNTIQEDDNDPSPVYLNFNLQNMSQAAQSFNTELENFSNQVVQANGDNTKKEDVVQYVEYQNNVTETMQPKLVDVNVQANQLFRQITTNIMPPAISKYQMQKIFNLSHDVERLNGAYMTEVLSPYQQYNNTICSYPEIQRQNLNFSRNIIRRKPLQTKLTIKQALTNQDWSLINNNHNNNERISSSDTANENSEDPTMTDTDLTNENSTLNFPQIDIPFITFRQPTRRERKQTLQPLPDVDISFMDNKGDFTKYDGSIDLTISEPRLPPDTSFITFRKKPKYEIIAEPIEESTPLAGRRLSTGKASRRESNLNSVSNSSAILISSDSDSEEDIQCSEIRCLKCNKCKKMFKTPRSYSIHRKRCEAPVSLDNSYIYEVEYLESEKEDDDQILSSEQYETTSKEDSLPSKEPIELIESDSIESLDIPKYILEESGNIVRRCTRSTQKSVVFNGISSSGSMSSSNSPTKSRRLKTLTSNCSENNKSLGILSCDICEKKFRQKSYLTAHKRIHEKSFKCQYCLKVFQIKSAYDTHITEKCEKIPATKLKRLRSTVSAK